MTSKNIPPLKSFFSGGFECADHINRSGIRINLQKETEHDLRVYDDYKLLKDIRISVVREGICWSEVETTPYQFDFSRLDPFFNAALSHDIQIIWDLCHFGYPDGLIPTHPQFVSRFVALADAFLEYHHKMTDAIPWLVPINEISFLSWHSGDVRGTVPFAINSGFDIKYHLCKASIAAMKRIRESFPQTVILAVEPLVKVHPSGIDSDFLDVFTKHEIQYQAMDMLTGRMCPELGGDDSLIDIYGANYYYNNQWDDLNRSIPWPDENGLLTPFSYLLQEVYERYGLPLMITETGHFGPLRKQWMDEIFVEIATALKNDIPIKGVCIYPIIDRPDWDDLSNYCNCGIWDMDESKNRIPHQPYIDAIRQGQELFQASTELTLKNSPLYSEKKPALNSA